MKKNFSYDDIGNSIIISNRKENEKVKKNFMFGNLIFSLTNSGKIVGLEINNLSGFLEESGIKNFDLNKIDNATLQVEEKRDLILIKFLIESKNNKFTIPVTRLPLQMIN